MSCFLEQVANNLRAKEGPNALVANMLCQVSHGPPPR
jgi:hypothetical protein